MTYLAEPEFIINTFPGYAKRINFGWKDLVIGRPRATLLFDVDELETFGLVGVYRTTDREDGPHPFGKEY